MILPTSTLAVSTAFRLTQQPTTNRQRRDKAQRNCQHAGRVTSSKRVMTGAQLPCYVIDHAK